MKDLTEEELVEAYYGEPGSREVTHLAACRECSMQFAELKRDIEGVMRTEVPERDAEYGERVWQALRPQLIPFEKKTPGWRRYFGTSWAQWRVAVLAVTCAALVAAAFFGGRIWERRQRAQVAGNAGQQVQQRVVLLVIADHLDRTERLLVALEHADSAGTAEDAQLQTDARELLATNRLYRATASHADDPALAGTLDKLQGVLAEVANDPNLTTKDLERIRNEMNTEGILFEIRVLRARGTEEMNRTTKGTESAKGATI